MNKPDNSPDGTGDLDQAIAAIADLYGFGGVRMYNNLVEGGVPPTHACQMVCSWIYAQVSRPDEKKG